MISVILETHTLGLKLEGSQFLSTLRLLRKPLWLSLSNIRWCKSNWRTNVLIGAFETALLNYPEMVADKSLQAASTSQFLYTPPQKELQGLLQARFGSRRIEGSPFHTSLSEHSDAVLTAPKQWHEDICWIVADWFESAWISSEFGANNHSVSGCSLREKRDDNPFVGTGASSNNRLIIP